MKLPLPNPAYLFFEKIGWHDKTAFDQWFTIVLNWMWTPTLFKLCIIVLLMALLGALDIWESLFN